MLSANALRCAKYIQRQKKVIITASTANTTSESKPVLSAQAVFDTFPSMRSIIPVRTRAALVTLVALGVVVLPTAFVVAPWLAGLTTSGQ